MAYQMWFGTRDYPQWISCPVVDADMSKVGWQSQQQYLNGGARVRRSSTAHKEYNLSWNLQSRDNIRQINDYADGIYGDGLIYFLDPFAMDKNVLPQYWAAPMLGADDGPILHGGVRPTIVATGTNGFGYPVKSAVYAVKADATITGAVGSGSVVTFTAANTYAVGDVVSISGITPSVYNLGTVTIATASSTQFTVNNTAVGTYSSGGTATVARPQLYIPIPAGYTAWIGAHGSATGTAAVKVTPTVGPATLGTPVNLTLLDVTSDTRVNESFDGDSYSGVLIELAGVGNLTLAGLIMQVIPTGVDAAIGGFISGQGNSGCHFAEQPKLQNYSSAMDLVGMTARLVEVGAWE